MDTAPLHKMEPTSRPGPWSPGGYPAQLYSLTLARIGVERLGLNV